MDTLNLHFNDWNWHKTCKMGGLSTQRMCYDELLMTLTGSTLLQRFLHAREMETECTILLADLAAGLGQPKVEVSSQISTQPAY